MKNEEVQNILSGMLSADIENTQHADNIKKITDYINELEKPNEEMIEKSKYDALKKQYTDRFFRSGEDEEEKPNKKPKDDVQAFTVNSLFK